MNNPPGQIVNRVPSKEYKPVHGGYPGTLHDHINPDGTEMVPNNVLDTEEMFSPTGNKGGPCGWNHCDWPECSCNQKKG